MRSKVTVVLLFLNVVLFFYIFQYEEKWRAEQKTLEARRRVLGPEAASIDSLTRTSRNGETVRLEKEKTGGTWRLTQPYDWPADQNALHRIINELQFLEHETSFAVADLAKSGLTLATYGLEQPAITLTFTSAGQPYTLQIGDDTKTSNRLYVLSPDRSRIHVVSRSLADSVGLGLDELRAAAIFSIPVFEVRSFNVQTAARSNLKIRLRRDTANRWSFESPINARASKTAVEVTLTKVNSLTARNFLDAANPRLEKSGLEAPLLRVTLEGNARRETLLIGNVATPPAAVPANPAEPGVPGTSTGPAAPGNATPAADVEYFAKIEDKSAVFTITVPASLIDDLSAAQEKLRDPRVLDFAPGTVTAVTLTAPDQPELSLQKLESAAGATPGWQVVTRLAGQAPLTIAADTKVVEDLLQKIYLLSAQEVGASGLPRFLSDAPSAADTENWGFNRPERELTLSLNTGGGVRGNEPSTLRLQVGVSPDKPGIAFARVTSAPFVYQILPDILADTPPVARHYRQRLLRDLPDGARITGLTLTDLTSNTPILTKQITEGDKNWDAVLADESKTRRTAFSALLPQLHTLSARRFTADAFNPDHADTPQGPRPWKYRLELTLAFPGASTAGPGTTSTLFLTERLGGTTQLAGTAEFGGVVFEATQELLDVLFVLIYSDKNDPGPAGAPVSINIKPPVFAAPTALPKDPVVPAPSKPEPKP